MMKSLLILFALVLSLNASEYKKDESKINVSGKFMTYYSAVDTKHTDNTMSHINMLYGSLQLNIDCENDGFYFQATPYIYEMRSDKSLRNPTRYDTLDESEFFFRSLYMSYTIENWTAGIGVLPFSNSFPMKYSDSTYQNGEGLNTINDNDLFSLFGIYKTENSKTIFGLGTTEEMGISTGDYIEPKLQDGTDVYFIINTYEHDKWTFTNEMMYIDMKYEEKDLSEIYLYGTGVVWDDTAESGLVVYNVAAVSMYENNSANVQDEIFNTVFAENPMGISGSQYGQGAMQQYPDSFAMGNGEKLYGASNLLGVRYEMDYFPMETFINVEWFRTFGDWTSGNQGNMYNGKLNQMFNVRDNSYYINYGILISKNSLLRFTYSYLEYDKFSKIGASADTVKAEDFMGGNKNVRDSLSVFHMIFTYRF